MTQYTIRIRPLDPELGDHLSIVSSDQISVSVALTGQFRLVDDRDNQQPTTEQQVAPQPTPRKRPRS